MKRINNKNGIKMFWERANDVDKINIYDSNENYFNDLSFDIYDNDNGSEDIEAILHTLEGTTLEEMCNFFGAKKYNSLEELVESEEITIKDLKDNDYLNVFDVNGKTFYTWSW